MRLRSGLTLLGNYTLSKQMEQWGFNDPYNNVYQQGLYFLDRPHVIKLTAIYEAAVRRRQAILRQLRTGSSIS